MNQSLNKHFAGVDICSGFLTDEPLNFFLKKEQESSLESETFFK